MELATLCAESGAPLEPLARLDGVEVSDLSLRLDRVSSGTFFACVPGSSRDGHELASLAAERGAAALLVERPLPAVALPQVRAEHVRAALGPLAHVLCGRPSEHLAVVGITGTNGKTTTAFLLAAMFDAAGRRSGLLGTVEARIGGAREPLSLTTPEAPDLHRLLARMREAGDEACVLEASSIALSMGRLDAVRFAAVGFTNLSQDHLDFHGSMDAYFAAKAALFDGRAPARRQRRRPGGKLAAGRAPLRHRDAVGRLGARASQLDGGGIAARGGDAARERSRSRARCGAASTSRTCSARSRSRCSSDLPDDAIVAGAAARGRATRAASSPSRPTSRSP